MANHKSVKASNVKVLSPSDHSHVKQTTPLKIKAKQMGTAPDVNKGREKRTTRLRRDKDVKPL